jgi:hypothetical protein
MLVIVPDTAPFPLGSGNGLAVCGAPPGNDEIRNYDFHLQSQ